MGKPQLHEDGHAMVMMNYTREDKDQSEVMVQCFSKEGGSAMAAGRTLNYRPFSGLPNYLKEQLMTLYSQNYVGLVKYYVYYYNYIGKKI